ncbi:hypothetical protein CI102_1228 [Trichoderma harzianum]|uniref:Uncharacterized protein n=1 Tax=Trichoderma harzianum CBS 226.95 TaxID=983964 RepID=A0A2T4AKW7_TRIHA|nr:hypothetical protein M431DRAFT_344150 [Trichoderma harzianum CBS 226.95]PKK53994.1 hypothetical protein CI102_1228 [Trichoderma harzianum]PTB57568.1 hypothetical protein M431DRAFT_344150 [Trichoderma harzianum CBS 226.95]
MKKKSSMARIRSGAAPNLPPIVTGAVQAFLVPSGDTGTWSGIFPRRLHCAYGSLSFANQIHIWTRPYGDIDKQCFSYAWFTKPFAVWIMPRMCRKFNTLRSVHFGKVLPATMTWVGRWKSGRSRTK